MTSGVGTYRVVGRAERDLPEDSVFSLDTSEQRKDYLERLWEMKSRDARSTPVYRLGPGEPRVKRFATLEDANADWMVCAIRAAEHRKGVAPCQGCEQNV